MNEFDEVVKKQSADAAGAFKPVSSNEFDETVRKLHVNDAGLLRKSLQLSSKVAPERAARVEAASKKSLLPKDLIERNLESIEQGQAMDPTKYQNMITQTPGLARWLGEEPMNVALAQDDLEGMGALEWVTKAPVKAFSAGQAQVEYGYLAFESMFAPPDVDTQQKMAELRNRMSQMQGKMGAQNWFSEALVMSANQVPMFTTPMVMGAQIAPALLGTAFGNPAARTMLGQQIEDGTVAKAGGFMFMQEAGHAYSEFLEVRDESGKRIDPQVAKAAALVAGAINSGLEFGQFGVLIKVIPGLKQLAARGMARKAIKDAIKKPSVRAALTEAMALYAGGLTAEVGIEVAQRAVTVMARELAKSASDIETIGAGEFLGELGNEGYEAAQAFAYMLLPGTVIGGGVNVYQVKQAQKTQAYFEALGGLAQKSKTIQRAPERVQDFIEKATKDGGVKEVYIDPARWNEYYQSVGLDGEAIAERLGLKDEIANATNEQRDMAIPMGIYAARIAPNQQNAGLALDLKLKPEDVTAREVQAIQEQLEQQAVSAEQGQQEAAASAAEAERISTELKTQLIANGQYDERTAEVLSRIHEQFTSVVGDRSNMVGALSDLYSRLSVGREMDPAQQGGQTLSQQPANTVPIGEMDPGQSQRVKQRAKIAVRQQVAEGKITAEHGFRGTSVAELMDIATTGKLSVGADAEGRPGISAADIGDGAFPMYGQGVGYIVPPEAKTPSGRAGESLVDERLDPRTLQYVIGDKVMSFDEMRETVAGDRVARIDPMSGQVFYQDSGPNEPGAVEDGNKHSLWPALRVMAPGIDNMPDKPLFLQKTTNKNAQKQIDSIDEVLALFTNPTSSIDEWSRMMSYALASSDVPVPPYALIRDINGAGLLNKINSLSAGQIADANHGFKQAKALRKAYTSGTFSVEVTGKLFLWSFLSRGVSPYIQESLFIDAFDGIDRWIDMAAAGTFDESVINEYDAWVRSVAPMGSGQPGAGATHNLNSFGKDFLRKMSLPSENGKSHLQNLHDMMSDPDQTGQNIRREFLKFGEGVGIDNKVVSFTLLVAGFDDVMVFDRVQIRQAWDDGRFAGKNLYDGDYETRTINGEEKRVPITGSRLGPIFDGARGLLIYEAIERDMMKGLPDVYAAVGRPKDASPGRYHWESWVAFSEQEASHGTLSAIAMSASGDDKAIAKVAAKQGEYGAYQYGASYARDKAGVAYFRYTTPAGSTYEFSVPAWRTFLAEVMRVSNRVVPAGFKVTNKRKLEDGTETEIDAGYSSRPWYERPGVDQAALDRQAEKWADRKNKSKRKQQDAAGNLAEWQAAADRKRLEKEGGQEFFQSAPAEGSEEFVEWAGTDKRPLEGEEVAYEPFTDGDGPWVLRTYHGTTHNLSEFRGSERGGKAGFMGAANYSTTSRYDADQNYGRIGPDLTGRIENATDQYIQQIWDDPGNWDLEHIENMPERAAEDLVRERAKAAALKDLYGGYEQTLELFVRTDKPLILNAADLKDSTRIPLYDQAALRDSAIEELARRIDSTPEAVQQSLESDDDLIDALDEIMAWMTDESLEGFVTALREVSSWYAGADPDQILQEIMEKSDGEGEISAQDLWGLIRNLYIDDPETGEPASGDFFMNLVTELGYDAVILKNADRRWPGMSMDVNTSHVHVADKYNTNIKSADRNEGGYSKSDPNIFRQEGARGRMRISPDRQFRIDLLEGADLSTFIHESGHFWLEVMGDIVDKISAADPASLTAKQIQMVKDYETLLDWFGVKDRSEIGVPHHEKFAQGIERYFMEGKAPSEGMRQIFARVAAWMKAIYKSLTRLNVGVTPEVRQVFDRMFATDAEIEAAAAQDGVGVLFANEQTLLDAGLGQEFVDAYRAQVQKAVDTAKEELRAKVMKTLEREREAWWNEEKVAARPAVEAELATQPVYIAQTVLRDGSMPDGTPAEVGPLKLARSALAPDEHKTLPKGITTAAAGGITPDQAAALFGFASGDELLAALKTALPFHEAVEVRVEGLLRERFGDPMLDGSIAEEAVNAVNNEARAQLIETEIRTLRRLQRLSQPAVEIERGKARQAAQERRSGLAMIRAGIPTLKAVRAVAARRIGSMRVLDIKPHLYLSAARRHSKLAIENAAKGEYGTALDDKVAEMLNVELYRAAQSALEQADKIRTYARSFDKGKVRSRIGRAGQDYLEQIDSIREGYEFTKASRPALAKRASLLEWVRQKEAAGEPVELPDSVVVERRQNYRELTVDELTGVYDALKHIEHLSKLKNRLLTQKDRADLQERAAELADSIRANTAKKTDIGIETRLPEDKLARAADRWFGSHRKLSSYVRELDGFTDNGPAFQLLLEPINRAADRETTMKAEASEKWAEIMSVYQGADMRELYKRKTIPALGMAISKMGRLMMALNVGNSVNKQRLMDGFDLNEEQLAAVLDTLDERDWKFVQDTWDFINSYWEASAAKEQRVSGVAPPKVEAEPVMTKFGEMRGGYFPLKYNPDIAPEVGARMIEEEAKQMIAGGYTRRTTARGHLKERAKHVELPVRLDFGVISEHVNQVIHDITHHEMLIDVNRLLRHKDISSAVMDTYGPEVLRQMKDTVNDAAAGPVIATKALERGMNHIRTGTSVAFLGWNLFTSLLQPLGLAQSITRIGGKWVMKGAYKWMSDAAHLENSARWINEKSEFMRARQSTQMREINEVMNQFGVNTGRLKGWVDTALSTATFGKIDRTAIADSFFWFIYKGQQIADIPTWLGAYEKAMATIPDITEERAISLADQAVRDSQGSGHIHDQSAVQRGGPLLKLWTNFYSYFNVTYNRLVESGKIARRTGGALGAGRLAVDYFLLMIFPAVMGAFMRMVMKGELDDADDEDIMGEIANELVSYHMGMMIGLREISAGVEAMVSKAMGTPARRQVTWSGPAGVRFFEAANRLGGQLGQGELDEALLKAMNETAGILLHYPAGQVQRTIGGYAALMNDETDNPLVLIGGPPRGK